MKPLRVYNYEILNFDTDPMVFSPSGFTKITEPKIIKALKHIKKTQHQYIQYSALEHILRKLNLPPVDAIGFLKNLSIIGETTAPPTFQRTIIFHDLEIPNELANHVEEHSNGTIKIRALSDYALPLTSTPTLFFFACAKLSPRSLKKTYEELLAMHPDCGASVGFISGNHFHLTEIHIPTIGNPCAFCTLDRIAHYESLRTSQHHWSKVWSFCRGNNINLPRAQVNEFHTSLILGALISFAKKYTQAPKSKTTQDQALLSKTINLETGVISEDISVHWPLCQCLGGN